MTRSFIGFLAVLFICSFYPANSQKDTDDFVIGFPTADSYVKGVGAMSKCYGFVGDSYVQLPSFVS